jgi:hypothetical protein
MEVETVASIRIADGFKCLGVSKYLSAGGLEDIIATNEVPG